MMTLTGVIYKPISDLGTILFTSAHSIFPKSLAQILQPDEFKHTRTRTLAAPYETSPNLHRSFLNYWSPGLVICFSDNVPKCSREGLSQCVREGWV